MNSAYLLIGSNIDPIDNTHRAIMLLKSMSQVLKISRAWETPAYGSPGPNFINLAVSIFTDLDYVQLKKDVARKIERILGRVRTIDKNAPRTIDIDIIIFNNEVFENSLWDLPHIALPMADLIPEFINPSNNASLYEISQQFQSNLQATRRDDLKFD